MISIPDRTKQFALRIIKAYGYLKKQNEECRLIGKQLFRSATSVGAMVREGISAQSLNDKINKMEIALKEARESQYWIELLIESELVPKERFQPLLNEAIREANSPAKLSECRRHSIGKILTASTKTLKSKK